MMPDLAIVADNTDPLEGYEPLLLTDQTLLAAYWGQAQPLLDKVIKKAGHGEFTTDHLFSAILAGTMYCFVVKKDNGELPDVALVIILEVCNYPGIKSMNIVALGGRQLNFFKSKFWDRICGWAYMSGVRHIESSVSPAMGRILTRYGFVATYTLMRMDLTES